jgi:branched-chain amino acid transport system substrate-binding protein
MFRRVVSGIGMMLVAALLGGCGSKPIVGVILPSTGSAASYGESIESGIRLALADARAQEQIPEGFEVVWADTGSDPERAVAVLKTMVSEHGVKMVIGGATSAEAVAMLPVLDELEVVCVSPSASAPGLAEKSRLFFRIYPSDELEGFTAGNVLYEKLKKYRVLLFTGDTEYTRGIKPEFLKQYDESLGGTVVDTIALSGDDWRERAATVLDRTGVDAVYVIGYAEEILDVVLFLHERRFAGRIVTTAAFYSGQVIREAGEAAEEILFPLPPFDRTSEKEPVLGFVNRYMDTYERAPDVFAAHGYDAMGLSIRIMNVAKPPETMEILKALSFGVSEYMGVTGPILFDEHGDVKHYPKMFIVKDGQVLSYQRYLETERRRILERVHELLNLGATATPTPTVQR